MRQRLEWDECHINFKDSIYDEINVSWCSLLIYDVYVDDGYVDNNSINNDNDNNSSDDVIINAFIDKLEAECKKNMKGVQQKYIYLSYIDPFRLKIYYYHKCIFVQELYAYNKCSWRK